MTTTVKAPVGLKVEFEPGKLLCVHPMTRRLINQHKDTFRKLEKGEFTSHIDVFDAQAELIFECLKLNYPEMTEEEFDGLLNSANQPLAWLALNSDFQSLELAKKAMAAFQSGSLTGTETPPTSPT